MRGDEDSGTGEQKRLSGKKHESSSPKANMPEERTNITQHCNVKGERAPMLEKKKKETGETKTSKTPVTMIAVR